MFTSDKGLCDHLNTHINTRVPIPTSFQLDHVKICAGCPGAFVTRAGKLFCGACRKLEEKERAQAKSAVDRSRGAKTGGY